MNEPDPLPDDPQARRDAHIKRLLAEAPPFTPEQRDKLLAIMRPAMRAARQQEPHDES